MLWSTAGIGQRELEASAATQVAGRSAVGMLTLLAIVCLVERRETVTAFRSMGRWGLAFAALMAISSGTFMLALNVTTVANVLFMQAASPMLAAVLGWALLGDRVGRRTWLSIGVAAVGVTVMIGGSLGGRPAATVLPVLMTAAFAGVVVIARHRAEVSMLPATALSQALVVVAAAPFVSVAGTSAGDWWILIGLGTGQMGLALALLTAGARLIPPAEVALLTLLEVVLGPLWVWLAYEERPGTTTLVGGAVVLVAVILQASARAPALTASQPLPG